MKQFFQTVTRLIKSAPITAVFSLLIVLVGVVTHLVTNHTEMATLIQTFGFGLPALQMGEWWTVFTGVFFVTEPWMYLTVLPPLIFGAGYIEYRFGALKMLATVFGVHILSVLVTALLLWAFSSGGQAWAIELAALRDVGVSNGAFGALGVATAALSRTWRFRVRSLAGMYCLVMVLYSAEVWDLTHFVALAIGFTIGPWVIGRSYDSLKPSISAINARAFTASLVLFVALAHVMTKIHPGNGGLLSFGNTQGSAESFIATTIFVFIALWFSFGLYNGRRAAWWVVLVLGALLLVAAVGVYAQTPSVVLGFDVVYYFILVATLIAFRKSFSSRANKASLKHLVVRLVAAAGLVFTATVAILYGIRNQFTPAPSLGDVLLESFARIFGASFGDFVPQSGVSHFALEAINDIWIIFLLIAVVTLIVGTQRKGSKDGKELYERLLKKWGGSTLSWMGTWKNLHYFSNSSETAILAYHLSGNVAVVLADPIGERRTASHLVEDFDEFCHENGWLVSYFSSSAWVQRLLKKHAYQSIQVAQDTVVKLPELEFTGKSWQSMRSSINKAAKLEVALHSVRLSELSKEIHDQLYAIEKSWVDDKALPEMGFTLGALAEASNPEVRLHIALDANGEVHGMTSWLPVYKKDGHIAGWTLDIMQRRLTDNTMPGVMEFLIA